MKVYLWYLLDHDKKNFRFEIFAHVWSVTASLLLPGVGYTKAHVYSLKKIVETLPTSEYTAYSENKGEKLAFCLDTKKGGNSNLIDLNTLTYVGLHELAHIMSKSIGHTPEFWDNFRFLLVEGKKIGIYEPVDYKKKPVRYCGMQISDNPYFDI